MYGNLEKIKECLANGTDVNMGDYGGKTTQHTLQKVAIWN